MNSRSKVKGFWSDANQSLRRIASPATDGKHSAGEVAFDGFLALERMIRHNRLALPSCLEDVLHAGSWRTTFRRLPAERGAARGPADQGSPAGTAGITAPDARNPLGHRPQSACLHGAARRAGCERP